MNKEKMVEFLKWHFESWKEVRDYMIGITRLNGWFAYWEGESVGDFSFCSEDPRGDTLGESITENDFNQEVE